ncbi:SufD family Fe-S cluster assembly protein [Serratia marcescens]|uniref:SufD family Fe-S cluster assembly protein n=1 Tax=Serratia marcescens TaxID=615 RepID=A0A939NLR9_SERMA|nr:SufD family Fe-S cluster assembly protein [Serratia marcescens]
MISAAKHAIKTDGQMTNHNLLLGKVAEGIPSRSWRSTPTTSNAANATVGRIDEEQLFYLQSRGIDKHAAQQMIILPSPPS